MKNVKLLSWTKSNLKKSDNAGSKRVLHELALGLNEIFQLSDEESSSDIFADTYFGDAEDNKIEYNSSSSEDDEEQANSEEPAGTNFNTGIAKIDTSTDEFIVSDDDF